MSGRRPIISANWKANQGDAADRQRVMEFAAAVDAPGGVEVTVHPPYTALAELSSSADGVSLGAQDCSRFEDGAHTGEVTATMLQTFGVEYVILGHSERRLAGEDPTLIAEKGVRAWRAGLNVILCCGESAAERDRGQTEEVIAAQIGEAVGCAPPSGDRLVIAYEPVWAIGSGVAASPHEAQETCLFVRGVLADCGLDLEADDVRVQYGGSVNPTNVAGFAACPDIDGVLVGGASLTPATFIPLVDAFEAPVLR